MSFSDKEYKLNIGIRCQKWYIYWEKHDQDQSYMGQGGNDIRDGQDEGSGTQIVRQLGGVRLVVAGVKRGSGDQKRIGVGGRELIRQDKA